MRTIKKSKIDEHRFDDSDDLTASRLMIMARAIEGKILFVRVARQNSGDDTEEIELPDLKEVRRLRDLLSEAIDFLEKNP